MKNAKKILPALAMLLVAAVMLTTASFAWFAMSSTATAQSMTVNLKSNTPFLLISAENDLDEMQSTNPISASATENNRKGTGDVVPVAHEISMSATDITTPAQWYTMEGTSADDGTGIDDTKTTIQELNGYVVQYTFYVAMAKGSAPGTDLRLSGPVTVTKPGTNETNGVEPISVIIACGGTMVELKHNGGTNDWTDTANTVLAPSVANDNTLAIEVFIYYDGAHADVKTSNFVNLSNASVSFQLEVDSQ